MTVCQKCGARNNEKGRFCVGCGSNIESSNLPPRDSTSSIGVAGDKNSPAFIGVNQNYNDNLQIQLSNNEVSIKNYHCTTLKASWFSPRAEGYITITNKRVIFHGYGRSSKLISEVPIETASGISTYLGAGWRIPFLILGVIFTLITLSTVTLANFHAIFLLVSLLFGAGAFYFFYNSRIQSYFLSVYSTGANGSPIAIGQGNTGNVLNSVTGQGALFSVGAEPTVDTLKLMSEIGAIILDLKTMGDHAIPRWLPNFAINPVNKNDGVINENIDDQGFF